MDTPTNPIIGRTEVFIAALTRGLARVGVSSAIAAPAHGSLSDDGTVSIFRFRIWPVTDASYYVPDKEAVHGFAQIVKKWRPLVAHLHARMSAVTTVNCAADRVKLYANLVEQPKWAA